MIYLDKCALKGRLMKFTPKIIDLFDKYKKGELSASEIDRLSFSIAKEGLDFASEERSKRKYNIPSDTDLVTERYDDNGLRRYSMRNMDDEAVMVPDEEGFWTPVNDILKRMGYGKQYDENCRKNL